jgi:hypothetical protein
VLAFEEYVCCLNSVERSVLRAMSLAFVAGLGEPVDGLIWQAFWGLTVKSRGARQSAFVAIFPLREEDTTPPGTTEVVTVYAFTDAAFWVGATAYFASPQGACLEGCDRWYPA